jgi:hypothetical protein
MKDKPNHDVGESEMNVKYVDKWNKTRIVSSTWYGVVHINMIKHTFVNNHDAYQSLLPGDLCMMYNMMVSNIHDSSFMQH